MLMREVGRKRLRAARSELSSASAASTGQWRRPGGHGEGSRRHSSNNSFPPHQGERSTWGGTHADHMQAASEQVAASGRRGRWPKSWESIVSRGVEVQLIEGKVGLARQAKSFADVFLEVDDFNT
jgi:hypothetical protein